MFLFNSERK